MLDRKRPRDDSTPSPAPSPKALYPRGLEVPDGWMDCPPFGTSVEGLNIVPIKAPLSVRFNPVIPPERRFTPRDVVELLGSRGIQIGLVLDLTNTSRYYDGSEWEDMGIRHLKIHCRGRGEVPEPDAVNIFCWEVLAFNKQQQELHREHREALRGAEGSEPMLHTVVHCTHGFNRTGYMIASFLVRSGKPLPTAVRLFATHRYPGIYKDHYLEALFTYNHFKRPKDLQTPPLPYWKSLEGSPEPGADDSVQDGALEQPEMHHDDLLGEAVPPDEVELVQQSVMQTMLSTPDRPYTSSGRAYFPGSQPVSLARDNLELLEQHRYWVTWKADGTRYLVLICTWGTYLIDRSFGVRRVQMRFPTRADRHGHSRPHHMTILDGEMVVDDNMVADQQNRRFLVYDLVVLNGVSKMYEPFKMRYAMVEEEVIKPRSKEKQAFASPAAKFVYTYDTELFHVRRKEFWPLPKATTLLQKFIPSLPHESDGLILQGWEDRYITGTCPQLLKWKFAHLNSVDFLLDIDEAGKPQMLLLVAQGRDRYLKPLGSLLDWGSMEREQLQALNGKIIECAYDLSKEVWVFMRERKDKDTPNAWHVYEKVMKSIRDNITQDVLLDYIQQALKHDVYAKDVKGHGH